MLSLQCHITITQHSVGSKPENASITVLVIAFLSMNFIERHVLSLHTLQEI